ncbi:augurin-A [Esox lucius]|uniref:ECRG4 augurin precursor n=1 Tax=Esox lucius TaxID=8010 RepID=A0AAY5L796_ESOLU|nr:augurin-A [Esox lucius]
MTFLSQHTQVFPPGMFVLWACGGDWSSDGCRFPSCFFFPLLPDTRTSGTENAMALHKLCLQILLLTVAFSYCAHSDDSKEGKLHRLLKRREAAVPGGVEAAPSEAKEFLRSLRRPRRNLWDRTRPDVQQWIMQFMHMGYDEARLETDLSYWMDLSRSSDQGRQHQYDENAPIGPQDPSSYRHGANVNYDYY